MPIDISVIVPIFNEEESVELMRESIIEALAPLGRPFEIIFVDDGSSDESFDCLATMAEQDNRIVVVKFRRNRGQTAAMMAGIEYACGRFLVTMDGDLQNDPADIPMMLAKLEEGYDLVVGWRINRQDRWLSRKLPSMLANWLIGKVTRLPIRDNGCSLKVYRGEFIKAVPLYSDMHRFIPAMNLPLGARIAEVGVRHHARQFGESKYGLSRIYKVLLDLIVIKTLLLFSRHPLRRFAWLAIVMSVPALWFGWQAVLGEGASGSGSLTTPTAVAMLFGSLVIYLLLLGVITGLIFRRAARTIPDWLEVPDQKVSEG